jgi:hypothetical protein
MSSISAFKDKLSSSRFDRGAEYAATSIVDARAPVRFVENESSRALAIWVRHPVRTGIGAAVSAVTSGDRNCRSARDPAVIQGLKRLDTKILVQYKRATFALLCTRDEGEQ